MAHEERTLTKRLAGDIAQSYGDHQKVLTSILRPFAELKARSIDIREARLKVHEIVRRLDVIAVHWSRTAIAEAYKSKRIETAPLAKKAAVFVTVKKLDEPDITIAKRIEAAAKSFLDANRTIEKTVDAFFTAFEKATGAVGMAKVETQFMAADMEMEMSRKVDWYLARGYDAGSISRKLRAYLEELVGGKNFIEIGGRFYELRAYAEMLARSELHNTYVDATIDECKQYDCDLLQVSRHDDPCPLCKAIEGRVFSISGEAENFPSLDEPVEVEVMTKTEIKTVQVDVRFPHPNCEHNLNPVTENILRAAGEL